MLLFFFNDTATTEIYTLSLHDALPISRRLRRVDEKVGSLVLLDVNGRVAQLLLDLADEAGSTRITRRLTHHTIAQMIGSSRETVSRTKRQLVEKGDIEITRREILIQDRAPLHAS